MGICNIGQLNKHILEIVLFMEIMMTSLFLTTIQTEFNYYFDHCLIKTTNNEFLDKNPNFNQCLFYENPGFMDENNGNFFLIFHLLLLILELKANNLDFFNINRTNLPDLGPFETDPNL